MQNSADGGLPAPSEGRNDSFASIVSNLVSLIQHIQASIELIETAIDQESHAGDQEIGADIVVLDDVTPRYAKATAALSACKPASAQPWNSCWIPRPRDRRPMEYRLPAFASAKAAQPYRSQPILLPRLPRRASLVTLSMIFVQTRSASVG